MILHDHEGSEARRELREVLASLFERVSPRAEAVLRADACSAGKYDEPLWQRLNQELGGVGLAVPEELGGAGAGFAELAVLFEAVGRELASVPLLGSYLAVEALVRSGDRGMAEQWVPGLVSGDIRGCFAFSGDVHATDGPEGWRLDGTVDLVADAPGADRLVLAAAAGSSTRLFAVPLHDARVVQRESLDLTRAFGHVELARSRAEAITSDSDPSELIEEVRDLAAAALACEQLGVAEQALADAVSYVQEREQFGRVIGSFQGIKHLLADMATSADLARSLVEHSVWAVTEHPARRRAAVAMAMLAASDAARFISGENVQVHGGIGFSWEHTAHLYFRKARSDAALLGNRSFFSERLLAEVTTAGTEV